MNSMYLSIMQEDVGRCLLWTTEAECDLPEFRREWYKRVMVWTKRALDAWMLENCHAESS